MCQRSYSLHLILIFPGMKEVASSLTVGFPLAFDAILLYDACLLFQLKLIQKYAASYIAFLPGLSS